MTTLTLDWTALVVGLFGPASIVAAVAFAFKTLSKHASQQVLLSIKQDYAKEMGDLKHAHNERLAVLEGVLGIESAEHAERRAKESARSERIRKVVATLAEPTREAIAHLASRLDNILKDELHDALRADFSPSPGWSMTHEYAIQSSEYLFARFFCITARLKAELGDEVFGEPNARERFAKLLNEASSPLSKYPLKGASANASATDAQLFSLQQLALGEALVVRERDDIRSMSYFEFRRALNSDELLGSLLIPVKRFLTTIRPETIVWERLKLLQANLVVLKDACEVVLNANGSAADGDANPMHHIHSSRRRTGR